MNSLIDYLVGKLGYVRPQMPQRTLPRRHTVSVSAARAFDAADAGRLVASWRGARGSIDDELRTQLPTMRARARDACQNNAFGINFIRKVRQNVVGPNGIRYQARARRDNGQLDEQDNDRLEEAYALSGEVGNYDVTGKLSRADGERLFIETVAQDGEALMRIVRGFDNEVGFAVEFLDPARLDWSLNVDRMNNGNRVVMGVELDGWSRPVAYYVRASAGEFDVFDAGRARVPARDIIHSFLPLRAGATRGVPWMHAGLVELWHLGKYKEAAIVAARIGANKVAWIRGADAEAVKGEGEDTDGNVVFPSEPGEYGQLPEDADIVDWTPEYPHQQFAMFNKAMLQGISSAWGVAYNTFANDLQGVNFSSMRGGVLDERDGWMMLQQWMINNYCRRLQREWLTYSLLARKIPSLAALPLGKEQKFRAADFQPRRWQWVDPLKDEQAADLGIARRSRSISSIIREQGHDPEEVWQEIAAEQKRMKDLGIAVSPPAAPAKPPAPVAAEEDETESAEEDE